MAHRTVGVGTSIGISLGTGTSTNPFNVQSNTIRIYAKGAPCYVAVGNTPLATSESYYIGADKEATLGMTKASNRVTGITTGTTTAVDFAEGTQCPFGTGEYVTISGVTPTTYNFSHKKIISINTQGIPGGYAQSRMVIDVDTSSGFADITNITDARAIASNKVSILGDGPNGAAYIQQVQISGDA
jgi:hypothetical protein